MLRNKEFRQFTVVFFLIAGIAVLLGFSLGRESGVLVLISSAAFWTVFLIFTRFRYQSIAQISEQIDLILHDAERLYIGDSEEGELSILHSEIMKMTLRIREQNRALKREKEHLAESLGDIAHQLRTPLTSANLILSLLENSPDEEERKELLRETEELFGQMDWLLTTLLKLSRLDAGIVTFQKKKIEGRTWMKEVIRPLLIPLELHQIDLRLDIPEKMEIYGDPDWLSQALQNILKNCMENAGDQGRIEIRCEDNPLFTEIEIHDSGAGFEKEELPHLFDRFYRGKQQGAVGYGIGLALCKNVITRQGGMITAKNHPQGGALFLIRFSK